MRASNSSFLISGHSETQQVPLNYAESTCLRGNSLIIVSNNNDKKTSIFPFVTRFVLLLSCFILVGQRSVKFGKHGCRLSPRELMKKTRVVVVRAILIKRVYMLYWGLPPGLPLFYELRTGKSRPTFRTLPSPQLCAALGGPSLLDAKKG